MKLIQEITLITLTLITLTSCQTNIPESIKADTVNKTTSQPILASRTEGNDYINFDSNACKTGGYKDPECKRVVIKGKTTGKSRVIRFYINSRQARTFNGKVDKSVGNLGIKQQMQVSVIADEMDRVVKSRTNIEQSVCEFEGLEVHCSYPIASGKVETMSFKDGKIQGSIKDNSAGTFTDNSEQATSSITTTRSTALDRATSDAQDCFARNRGQDQRVCIPHLTEMKEAAKTGR
jgi:hypothetical protein